MNERADSPNGVCLYAGTWEEWCDELKDRPKVKRIPITITRQIVKISVDDYSDILED
jgi:hypothetical protein